MNLSFPERTQFGAGRQEAGFRHVKCEMPMRH